MPRTELGDIINTMPDHQDQSNPTNFRASGPAPEPDSLPGERPIYEMSVESCRELDHLATTELGIPSIVLMENAAIALANHAVSMLEDARSSSILIATGSGNNAGDGFAAARHLTNQGYHPTMIATASGDQISGDAKVNLDIITKMNLKIIPASTYLDQLTKSPAPPPGLIIDAIFGTGLSRPITGIANELIAHINAAKQAGALILAVDVPSGLDAQTGLALGESIVISDQTITFAALKDGYRAFEAQQYLGKVTVAPIGIPEQLLARLGRPVQLPPDPHIQ